METKFRRAHAPDRAVGPSASTGAPPAASNVYELTSHDHARHVAHLIVLKTLNVPLSSWTKWFISEKRRLPSSSNCADESLDELPEELFTISLPQ